MFLYRKSISQENDRNNTIECMLIANDEKHMMRCEYDPKEIAAAKFDYLTVMECQMWRSVWRTIIEKYNLGVLQYLKPQSL